MGKEVGVEDECSEVRAFPERGACDLIRRKWLKVHLILAQGASMADIVFLQLPLISDLLTFLYLIILVKTS